MNVNVIAFSNDCASFLLSTFQSPLPLSPFSSLFKDISSKAEATGNNISTILSIPSILATHLVLHTLMRTSWLLLGNNYFIFLTRCCCCFGELLKNSVNFLTVAIMSLTSWYERVLAMHRFRRWFIQWK